MVRFLFAAVLACAPAAWADASALVQKAQGEARALEYPAALKTLDAALATAGNERATLLAIYQLQGICHAILGQEPKALKAFQALLSLDPERRLSGSHPPRVTTAFFEARSWVAQVGSLAAQAAPASIEGGKVEQLAVEVKADPLRLAREVRFHLQLEGRESVVDVSLRGGAAAAPVGAPKVTWWAELLGEKKAVLLAVVPQSAPLSETAPTSSGSGATAAAEPAAAPVAEQPRQAPAPAVETAPAARLVPGARVAGLVLAALGLGAAGAGIGLGAASAGTAARFSSLPRDAEGRVTGMTQREALALDAQQRTEAALGNVFLIGGGALAAAGVVIFAVSFAGGGEVAIVPSGSGAALVGTFP